MQLDMVPTMLVAGVVLAGLYGFLPISIILSYRISRTIAFVHGGIAAAAALVYWLLALDNQLLPDFLIEYRGHRFGERPELDPLLAMGLTLALGAALGAAYGAIVMSRRIAGLAALTLTIVSLGAMMGLVGVFGLFNVQATVAPQSPFGEGLHTIGDVAITDHKAITLVLALALSLVIGVLLTRTHTGVLIRAVADDHEAGVWCGVKLHRIGTMVYAGSGAIAALAGVLIAVTAGPDPADMLVLYLNSLAIAIVGGLRSLPLAFAGAVLFALVETGLILGVFGEIPSMFAVLVLYGSLLAAIVILARLRREDFFLLERQSL